MPRPSLFALLLFALSAPAVAQEEEGPPQPNLVLGLGVGLLDEPYADYDGNKDPILVPGIAWSKGGFSIAGKSASYDLSERDNLTFYLLGDVRFQGYEEEDSPVLAGMDKRRSTIEAGAGVNADLGPFEAVGTFSHDLLGRHGGYEAKLRLGLPWSPHIATQVTPYVGVGFQSEDLANYYYGVRQDEALVADEFGPGRPAYEPGASTVPFAGVLARQALSRRLVVFASYRREFLPEAITDSPIIDKDSRSSLFGGVSVLFY